MADDSLLNWLRLARLEGVGPVLIKRLLEALGSPEAILNAHPARLAQVEGIGQHRANQIVRSAPATEQSARDELALARQHNLTLITPADERYPPGLKSIHDPPLVLYIRGELLPTDAVAIGIVGARQCSLYGREQSTRLAHELAQAGLTIISGGARGIDTCAHLGALRAGGAGRTLVIQGCGLLHTYPPENVDLYGRIITENAGAIISEFPLDTSPLAENFPPRNRIIAGMSLGVLVVEANLRSGSLITARLAAADYGREVFALPGRVDSPASAGTHHLIKSAVAHLVESAEDILHHLGDVGAALKKASENMRPDTQNTNQPDESLFPAAISSPSPQKPLTSVQQKILDAIPSTPKGIDIDGLVETTSLPANIIMAELTLLQIQNHITRLPSNRFTRK